MLRRLFTAAVSVALGVVLGVSPALAQGGPVQPAATSDVGPWEAVVWTRDTLVHRCTLSRARNAPDGVTYGFLIDREGILLGVASRSFEFASEAPVQVSLAPQSGEMRKLTARPVSNRRANIELPKPMLDQLQRSEHADVQFGDKKVRLPFDDFNAARVTLEICVQKIGKKHEAAR